MDHFKKKLEGMDSILDNIDQLHGIAKSMVEWLSDERYDTPSNGTTVDTAMQAMASIGYLTIDYATAFVNRATRKE
jgi:hypothetical protein